jgi:hypothetical protein
VEVGSETTGDFELVDGRVSPFTGVCVSSLFSPFAVAWGRDVGAGSIDVEVDSVVVVGSDVSVKDTCVPASFDTSPFDSDAGFELESRLASVGVWRSAMVDVVQKGGSLGCARTFVGRLCSVDGPDGVSLESGKEVLTFKASHSNGRKQEAFKEELGISRCVLFVDTRILQSAKDWRIGDALQGTTSSRGRKRLECSQEQ